MGSVAVRLVGKWIAGYNFAVTCPLLYGCCRHQLPRCLTRRYCSHTHDNIRENQELSVRGLLNIGFTENQAEHIYDTVCKSRGGSTAKHALSTLSSLIVLGLNPSTVLKLLEKCPELYFVKEAQLQQRIGNLRKLGLVEGSLQRVVSYHPQILTMKIKDINHLVLFLKEKCLFTTQQVTDILRDSPAIIQEDLDQLNYKFQYAYFRMGVKQAEMVKSKLFRFSLDEVRNRHCFLERRRMYETPDKKGQTTIVNPKLSSILHVEVDMFVTLVAKATSEEFDVFKRLLAREWQDEEHVVDFDSVSGDDEVEDAEQEEENMGKMGYIKRKKKQIRLTYKHKES